MESYPANIGGLLLIKGEKFSNPSTKVFVSNTESKVYYFSGELVGIVLPPLEPGLTLIELTTPYGIDYAYIDIIDWAGSYTAGEIAIWGVAFIEAQCKAALEEKEKQVKDAIDEIRAAKDKKEKEKIRIAFAEVIKTIIKLSKIAIDSLAKGFVDEINKKKESKWSKDNAKKKIENAKKDHKKKLDEAKKSNLERLKNAVKETPKFVARGKFKVFYPPIPKLGRNL